MAPSHDQSRKRMLKSCTTLGCPATCRLATQDSLLNWIFFTTFKTNLYNFHNFHNTHITKCCSISTQNYIPKAQLLILVQLPQLYKFAQVLRFDTLHKISINVTQHFDIAKTQLFLKHPPISCTGSSASHHYVPDSKVSQSDRHGTFYSKVC